MGCPARVGTCLVSRVWRVAMLCNRYCVNDNQPLIMKPDPIKENIYTPGPWFWKLNEESKQIDLISQTSGQPIVMDFVRWGFQSAIPRFKVKWLMMPAHEFGAVIPGHEHHKHFLKAIDHPDARLIASAPDLLNSLRETHAALCMTQPDYIGSAMYHDNRNAIHNAIGEYN